MGFKRLGLLVIDLGGRECAMAEKGGGNPHVLGIGDGERCSGGVAECVDAHRFTELVFGAGADAIIDGHLGHGGGVLRDPERTSRVARPTAVAGEKIRTMVCEIGLKRFVQNGGKQDLMHLAGLGFRLVEEDEPATIDCDKVLVEDQIGEIAASDRNKC